MRAQNILITCLHNINIIFQVHIPLVKWEKREMLQVQVDFLLPFSSSHLKVKINILYVGILRTVLWTCLWEIRCGQRVILTQVELNTDFCDGLCDKSCPENLREKLTLLPWLFKESVWAVQQRLFHAGVARVGSHLLWCVSWEMMKGNLLYSMSCVKGTVQSPGQSLPVYFTRVGWTSEETSSPWWEFPPSAAPKGLPKLWPSWALTLEWLGVSLTILSLGNLRNKAGGSEELEV